MCPPYFKRVLYIHFAGEAVSINTLSLGLIFAKGSTVKPRPSDPPGIYLYPSPSNNDVLVSVKYSATMTRSHGILGNLLSVITSPLPTEINKYNRLSEEDLQIVKVRMQGTINPTWYQTSYWHEESPSHSPRHVELWKSKPRHTEPRSPADYVRINYPLESKDLPFGNPLSHRISATQSNVEIAENAIKNLLRKTENFTRIYIDAHCKKHSDEISYSVINKEGLGTIESRLNFADVKVLLCYIPRQKRHNIQIYLLICHGSYFARRLAIELNTEYFTNFSIVVDPFVHAVDAVNTTPGVISDHFSTGKYGMKRELKLEHPPIYKIVYHNYSGRYIEVVDYNGPRGFKAMHMKSPAIPVESNPIPQGQYPFPITRLDDLDRLREEFEEYVKFVSWKAITHVLISTQEMKSLPLGSLTQKLQDKPRMVRLWQEEIQTATGLHDVEDVNLCQYILSKLHDLFELLRKDQDKTQPFKDIIRHDFRDKFLILNSILSVLERSR